MSEPIWTGLDVYVRIYFDDGLGNRINEEGEPFNEEVDLPILEYCFFESATVNGTVPLERRPVTGRPFEKIVAQQYQYEMDVSYLYFKKSAELKLESIFNRENRLQIDMFCDGAPYGKIDDHHILKVATAQSFTKRMSDNENGTGSAKFLAERFE